MKSYEAQTPFKVGRVKYAVILPKDLAPIWDKIMRENK
jgi:hypothetical protein